MMNVRVVVPSAAAAAPLPSTSHSVPVKCRTISVLCDAVQHVAQAAFLVLPHAYAIINEMKQCYERN